MTTPQNFISVRELLAALDGRLSRNAVYKAIAKGQIPHIRVGRRILLRADCLARMEAGNAGQERRA